jgi:hypothetical protein
LNVYCVLHIDKGAFNIDQLYISTSLALLLLFSTSCRTRVLPVMMLIHLNSFTSRCINNRRTAAAGEKKGNIQRLYPPLAGFH